MKDSSNSRVSGSSSAGRQRLFAVVAVVFALALVETGLQVIHAVMKPGERFEQDYRLAHSAFADKPWAKELFREFYELPKHYEPFLGWDRGEYHGQYINIDSNGVRRTWNPIEFASGAPDTILMFGGSTTWGCLARDDYTIPSHLSRLLHEKGYEFVVQNYGETGYTFRQEIVHLILLLTEEHRPKHVSFYDGLNDVYGAYQCGEEGVIQNLDIMREKLLSRTPVEVIGAGMTEFISREIMIYKALRGLYHLVIPEPQFAEVGHTFDREELRTLSNNIADNYLKSMKLLDNLSKMYGFTYTCSWHPVTFTEAELLADEEKADPRSSDEVLGKLFTLTTEILKEKSPSHFYDLTGALAGRTEPMYIDLCHLTEEGNKMAAAALLPVFESEVLSDE